MEDSFRGQKTQAPTNIVKVLKESEYSRKATTVLYQLDNRLQANFIASILTEGKSVCRNRNTWAFWRIVTPVSRRTECMLKLNYTTLHFACTKWRYLQILYDFCWHHNAMHWNGVNFITLC